MEPVEGQEITRFGVWYNHDGVKRAADVRRIETENRTFYSCRLFNHTEEVIEQTMDDKGNTIWKLLYGDITPLSINLGMAIIVV